LSELADDQELIAFKFVGQSTKQGIVSHLSQTLGVDVNILFANIDQIDGQNVGDMIAIITGNLPAFNQAIAQLADQGVQTHVINEQDVKELVD
jgi:D-methionine transport system ATP-binding protein